MLWLGADAQPFSFISLDKFRLRLYKSGGKWGIMFIGQFEHSLDNKNRLFIPAKFRHDQKKFVATCGLENCLFLFSQPAWDEIATKLNSLPLTKAEARKFLRIFSSGAQDCEVDLQGRILLPRFLLDYASIKKQVTVTGVINRIEIWAKANWDKFYRQTKPKYEEFAEKLTDLGI